MMINIHRRCYFDPRFTDFWNESFEAEIDDYAREVLAPAIDDQLFVPPDVNSTFFQKRDKFEMTLVLDKNGRVTNQSVRKSSLSEEFDKLIEQAFRSSLECFVPLPDRAGESTEFILQASPHGVLLYPVIISFDMLDSVATGVRDKVNYVAGRYRTVLPITCLIRLTPTDAVIQSWDRQPDNTALAFLDEVKTELTTLARPKDFPRELRFIHEGGSTTFYDRSRRGLLPEDSSKKRAERREWLVKADSAKQLLPKCIERWRREHSDMSFNEALRYVFEGREFKTGLSLCEDYIRLYPHRKRGYEARIWVLDAQARNTNRELAFAEQIMEECHDIFRLFPEENNVDLWQNICHSLILLGKYEQLDEALAHCSKLLHSYRYIAAAFEAVQDWNSAADHYRRYLRALGRKPDPATEPTKKELSDCEDLIALANQSTSVAEATAKLKKRFGLTEEEASLALRMFTFDQ